MAQNWIEGRVIQRIDWTPTVRSLRVAADIEPWQAGQFTKLALASHDEVVGRPYSIVNPPGETPLDFVFNVVPDGPLSPRLARLEAGERVLVAPRAAGFFILAEVPEAKHLWLMASGTGIGPFLAILRTTDTWRRFARVTLVHTVRAARDLTYPEVIQGIARSHPSKFQFVPFVSREATDFALAGRIPQAIADGRLETRAGTALAPEDSQVMLCGNPGMVEDVTRALGERGMRKHRRREPGQITVETYW